MTTSKYRVGSNANIEAGGIRYPRFRVRVSVSLHVAAAVVCFLLILSSSCLAQSTWWSFGPKVGYRWGSGWEGGVELSVFPSDQTPTKPPNYGYTVDLMPFSHTPSYRLGAEISYAYAGADAGILVLEDSGVFRVGLSSILFAGPGESITILSTDSECARLFRLGDYFANTSHNRQAYDTLRYYVESCAAADSNARLALLTLDGAVGGLSSPNMGIYTDYREWLKRVLYLNAAQSYYCGVAGSIISSMRWFDARRGNDYNGRCAIIKYLLGSHKCPQDEQALGEFYAELRRSQAAQWYDTLGGDTVGKSMDTTLPTLKDLGLEVLEGPDFAISVRTNVEGSALLSCDLVANPSLENPKLRFELRSPSYVSIQVFDILGKVVTSGEPALENTGIHIRNVAALNCGVYYIRLSAGNQVRTIRFLKR